MVRLFGRPSRSYASQANLYLDPSSSYPLPHEDEPRPLPTSQSRYAPSDVGRSTGRDWQHVPTQVARAPGGRKTMSEVGVSAAPSKKKKKVVRMTDSEVGAAPMPTAGPSSLFNGAHAKSAAGPSVQGPASAPVSPKAKRQPSAKKRNQDITSAMATFSALSLAPPPPTRRGGTVLNGEDATPHRDVVAGRNASPAGTYDASFDSDDGEGYRSRSRSRSGSDLSQASNSGSVVSRDGGRHSRREEPSMSYKHRRPSPLDGSALVSPTYQPAPGIDTPPLSASDLGSSNLGNAQAGPSRSSPDVAVVTPPAEERRALSPGVTVVSGGRDSLRSQPEEATPKPEDEAPRALSPLRNERQDSEHPTFMPIVQQAPPMSTPPIDESRRPFETPPTGLAAPSVSIQPPTPMHDPDATPFHAEESDSPTVASPTEGLGAGAGNVPQPLATESSSTPYDSLALGAPIGSSSAPPAAPAVAPPPLPARAPERSAAAPPGLSPRTAQDVEPPTLTPPTLPPRSEVLDTPALEHEDYVYPLPSDEPPLPPRPGSHPGSSEHSRHSSSESVPRRPRYSPSNTMAMASQQMQQQQAHLQPVPAPRSVTASRAPSSRASSDGGGAKSHASKSPSRALSRSSSRAWQQPVQPPVSVPFLPPADPSQPSFLRWEPSMQRWVPSAGAAPQEKAGQIARPHSVISSAASSYSQASEARHSMAPPPMPVFPAQFESATRRASLPHLQTVALRQAASSSTSELGSPNRLSARPPSVTGVSPGGLGGRRPSIEPAHAISPSLLTFLPESTDQQLADMMPEPTSRPSSRPPSRAGSVRDVNMRRPNSSMSQYRSRNTAVFPTGYDVNARAWAMSQSGVDQADYASRAGSDAGDAVSEVGSHAASAVGGSQYGGSRAASVVGGSQYGGSQVGMHTYRPASRAASRVGRESALDNMSSRGEPVPLLGATGENSEGLNGYTSLILPTGAYKPKSDPTKNLDKIDPRVLGMPTTSMSSITINSTQSVRRRSRNEAPTPAHLRAKEPIPVSYSSHQAPPSKVSPAQVLVQVYTVALDRTDLDMVMEKATAGSGVGKWVPGRSFCGRALDVGADVRTIVKGDLVMGLVDVKKSGTLAEYIICDRRRISRTPAGTHLSLEQLACLPLLGVLAHRAAAVGCTRGSRALVLHAHEGVGALVCQELSAMGINVIAHAPHSAFGAEDDCYDNGAREVILDDDEVTVLNAQHESSFEYVLDTVGGRRIYDASRRVLRTTGFFITLFGDEGDKSAVPKSPIKASFHSLRRAFVRKDKKAISYIHLAPAAGGTVVGGGDVDPSGLDSRDVLELPVMGMYRPKVGMVIPFERAQDALDAVEQRKRARGRYGEEDEAESGAVVVRLVN